MLCRCLLEKGEGHGVKKCKKGHFKDRLLRGRTELQKGGDFVPGFPKEVLNCMFLFLITKQYLLT